MNRSIKEYQNKLNGNMPESTTLQAICVEYAE